MKGIGGSLIWLAVAVAMASGAASAMGGTDSLGADASDASGGVVERRVVGHGSWLYESLKQALPSGGLAAVVRVQVAYPAELDWSNDSALHMNRQLNAWLARDDAFSAVAKDGSLEVPNAPETTPPIGTRHPIVVSCANIKTSTSSSFSADITYTFEYRFTRDTNGDNKPDADPQWVIVDVKITPLFTDGQPHLC